MLIIGIVNLKEVVIKIVPILSNSNVLEEIEALVLVMGVIIIVLADIVNTDMMQLRLIMIIKNF